MKSQFHVNLETGRTGICKAVYNCPFGSANEHFDDRSGARVYYESYMENETLNNTVSKSLSIKDSSGKIEIHTLEQANKIINNRISKNNKLKTMSKIQKQNLEKALNNKMPLTDSKLGERLNFVQGLTKELNELGFDTETMFSRKSANGMTIYNEERQKIHKEILEDLEVKYKDIPTDSKALMAGGLGGAGKGTILHSMGVGSDYATINPDDIKEELAKKGAIPKIDGLTPMEASTLVHEESSYLSKVLAAKLMKEKKNIVYDLTMGGYNSTAFKIDELKKSGYEVKSVFVDITLAKSKARAESRYRIGLDQYVESGGTSIGGRPVPEGVNQPSKKNLNSQNADNLVMLYDQGKLDSIPNVYSNMGDSPKRLNFGFFSL